MSPFIIAETRHLRHNPRGASGASGRPHFGHTAVVDEWVLTVCFVQQGIGPFLSKKFENVQSTSTVSKWRSSSSTSSGFSTVFATSSNNNARNRPRIR